MVLLSKINIGQMDKTKLMLLSVPIIIGSGACLYYYLYASNENKKQTKDDKSNTKSTKSFKSGELKNIGNELFKDKKYKEAIVKYTQAIEFCPPDRKKDLAIFYQNRAACYENLKLFDLVIKDCTQAIEYDKTYIKAYLRRGKAYEFLENFDKASFDFFVVNTSTQFQNSDYSALLYDVLNKYAYDKAMEITKKRKIFSFQKYMFQHLLNKFSRDPLRKCSEILNDYDNVVKKLLNDNSSEDQLDINQLLLKATIQLYIGKHEYGEATLRKIIDDTDDNDYKVNCMLKLAEYYLQLGKLEEAGKLIDEAEIVDNTNADVPFFRSQLSIIQKNMEDAFKNLDKSIELDPSFVAPIGQKLNLQYQYLLMTNDFINRNRLFKEFEQTIEKFPKINDIVLLYFQILLSQNDSKKAEKYILKAIENDPTDPTLYVYKALIYIEAGNFDKTQEILQQALKMDSKCSFAYEMLSDLCVKLENLKDAIEYLDSAINCSTSFEDVKNLILKQKSFEMQLKLN